MNLFDLRRHAAVHHLMVTDRLLRQVARNSQVSGDMNPRACGPDLPETYPAVQRWPRRR
ncbi:MAG: hypothetical protein VKO21_10125 [Candidatus Sericytochromatia bacterium]|nr:hypothetical protein [Candidatus Sericytochromatia bacterium]